MAIQNNLVAKSEKMTFSNFIASDAVKDKITGMIGQKDSPIFITSIISAVSVNPTLAECDFPSILSAAMLGASLKLSPSPQLGQYYLVPYNNTKRNKKEAQFQLGYKGYIQLAIRSGYYKKLNVMSIKEGELISFDPLNEDIKAKLIEDDLVREQANTIGYYAFFEYANGFRKAMYWSYGKMINHADNYSSAFSARNYQDLLSGKIPKEDLWKFSSFWYKDFDAMAYKTMLRQLISKWGIMSIELQQAIDVDVEKPEEKQNYEDDFFASQPDQTIETETTQI